MADALTGLELEILQDQAESLGLAGRRLQQAIDRFTAMRSGLEAGDEDALLNEIAARAWALIVQRELIGFRQESLRWVTREFDIPAEALRRLGQTN